MTDQKSSTTLPSCHCGCSFRQAKGVLLGGGIPEIDSRPSTAYSFLAAMRRHRPTMSWPVIPPSMLP